MATIRQLEANRENAQYSTGPITEAGKAIVSMNAVSHGLASRQLLLPTEDESELRALSTRLFSELQPRNEIENFLVHQILVAAWKLRRMNMIETQLWNWHADGGKDQYALSWIKLCKKDLPDKIHRYSASIERSFYRALKELKELKELA